MLLLLLLPKCNGDAIRRRDTQTLLRDSAASSSATDLSVRGGSPRAPCNSMQTVSYIVLFS